MQKKCRILLVDPCTEHTREIIQQLAPDLSVLVHRNISSKAELTQALQEEDWDAVVCGDSLSATDTLHSFFANLPGMACQISLGRDGSLNFPYVSEGCFALFGIAPQVIEQQPQHLLDLLHPADREMFHASLKRSLAKLTPWNWEGRIVLPPNNEIKWVNLRATIRENDAHSTIWEGFMVNITHNKALEQTIKLSRQRLRQLSSHEESIKEEERMRIAREIHDEIGVLLTALKMDLAWLQQRLPQDNAALHEKAQSMSDLLDTAGTSANNLVHSLRPGFLDCFGIIAAIEIEAHEFTKRTGIPCKITKSDDSIELPNEQSITLFRVFQETLNNIMKHAMAKHVHIDIRKVGCGIGLTVEDDGKGFDEAARNKPRSFGLRGMQERLRNLGGDVCITSAPEQGTKIEVCMPIDEAPSCRTSESQQVLF